MKKSGKRQHHVTEEQAGETIAAVLKQWQSAISWTQARRLLTSRRVSINGTVCVDVGRRVKQGDVLHLLEHSKTPLPTAKDIEILYLDTHIVVAVKPALMTTLRHVEERGWDAKRKNLQPTMDESLPQVIEAEETRGQRPNGDVRQRGQNQRRGAKGRQQPSRKTRVRPVHRLDRDTSGVMVFARTPQAELQLIRQFKRHSIERRYRAVVHGHPPAQKIESRLVRDRGDGLRGSTENAGEGERAVTHVRPIEELGAYSLIECQLETGRTHQIRIHLSELGHLLCGDTMYHKRRDGTSIPDRSGAPRLALHAAELVFDHPISGKRLKFATPLPKDLAAFIKRMRPKQREGTDEPS